MSAMELVDMSKFPGVLCDKINGIIARCTSKGQKVSGAEEVLNLLKEAGLMWEVQGAPEFTGVSRFNRKSYGVGAADSQFLGADILEQGWSWVKSANCVDIEVAPHPHCIEELEFQQQLMEVNGDILPALKALHSVSLSGAHTNTFLRQCKAGVTSVVPTLADPSGKLNFDMLKLDRPAFEEAVTKGLKWKRISWMAGVVFPDLPDFLQDALNITVHRGLSELEVMLGIHKHAVAISIRQPGADIDWQACVANATSSNPGCAAWAHVLGQYVKLNAGGNDGSLLEEVNAFMKAVGPKTGAPRILGSEFMARLVGLNFGSGVRYPYLQNAIMKCNLASPASMVVDGRCTLISPSNIASFASKENKVKVGSIEALLLEARKLIDTVQVDAGVKAKLLGQLDCRCVLRVLKRNHVLEKGAKFQSVADVAQAFVKDLAAATGVQVSFPSSIAASSDTSVSATPAAVTAAMESIDEMKSLRFQCVKAGFKPGAHVALKAAKQTGICRIESIDESHAGIVEMSNGEIVPGSEVSVGVGVLMAEWRLHKGKVVAKLEGYTPGEHRHTPIGSASFGFDAAKAAITLVMFNAYKSMDNVLLSTDILSTPTAVLATGAFKQGQLRIYPASQTIVKVPNPKSVCVGVFPLSGQDVPLYINLQFQGVIDTQGSPTKFPWVAHFWAVRNADENNCNMELRYELHDIGGFKVYLPLLVNTCAVATGTELFWQKVEMPKTALECNAFIASHMDRKRSAATPAAAEKKVARKHR